MTTTDATPEVFDLQRLALTLVQADYEVDASQVDAVLASITEPQIGFFLVALADLVQHSLAASSSTDLAAFVAHHRTVIDRAEQAWNDHNE